MDPVISSNSENPEKSYSFQWAEGVYNTFVSCYPRATAIFKIMHKKSDYELIHYLATNQERWERFKKVTKRIEKWWKQHTFREVGELTTQMYTALYYALVKEFHFYDENRKFALDMGFDCSILEDGRNNRRETAKGLALSGFQPSL